MRFAYLHIFYKQSTQISDYGHDQTSHIFFSPEKILFENSGWSINTFRLFLPDKCLGRPTLWRMFSKKEQKPEHLESYNLSFSFVFFTETDKIWTKYKCVLTGNFPSYWNSKSDYIVPLQTIWQNSCPKKLGTALWRISRQASRSQSTKLLFYFFISLSHICRYFVLKRRFNQSIFVILASDSNL